MVTIVHGDLFDSEMQTLTNAINCKGVMGAGIALGFANHFPGMLEDYKNKCALGAVKLDTPYLWVNDEDEAHGRRPDVLNFPTMDYPGERADLDQILQGLDHLIEHGKAWGIKSIAVPALGCGIGGLVFEDVVAPFSERLERLEIPVELYAPNSPGAEDQLQRLGSRKGD